MPDSEHDKFWDKVAELGGSFIPPTPQPPTPEPPVPEVLEPELPL